MRQGSIYVWASFLCSSGGFLCWPLLEMGRRQLLTLTWCEHSCTDGWSNKLLQRGKQALFAKPKPEKNKCRNFHEIMLVCSGEFKQKPELTFERIQVVFTCLEIIGRKYKIRKKSCLVYLVQVRQVGQVEEMQCLYLPEQEMCWDELCINRKCAEMSSACWK